jgi:zinc finger RNA-binding protein
MRVGLLAKSLLLRGDTDVKLIVICSNRPTKSLLQHVHEILVEKITSVSTDIKYSVILDKEAETIMVVRLMSVSDLHPLITCKVLLTSPSIRPTDDAGQPLAG